MMSYLPKIPKIREDTWPGSIEGVDRRREGSFEGAALRGPPALRRHTREPKSREEPGRRLAFTGCPSGEATTATSSGSAGGHVCCLDPRRPT